MTGIPDGFAPHEHSSPYHELLGPLYVRRDGGMVSIGIRAARLVFINCFVYRGTERIARGGGTFLVMAG